MFRGISGIRGIGNPSRIASGLEPGRNARGEIADRSPGEKRPGNRPRRNARVPAHGLASRSVANPDRAPLPPLAYWRVGSCHALAIGITTATNLSSSTG